MHILLFIYITQNSQSALFHDAKIPNLALFCESKIPNMRGTGPIPNEAKKIADLANRKYKILAGVQPYFSKT